MKRTLVLVLVLPFAPACAESDGDDGDGGGDPEAQAILSVKEYVGAELDALVDASTRIQTAAPAPDADGWNATADAAAVDGMRTSWHDARVSYERVEGAIAVLFPDLDAATDERYDGFIAEAPDPQLFDGTGVTGVHAIERILWADAHPTWVVEFESALPEYVAASFPATEADADQFKNGLAAQLVTDTNTMRDDFEPLALDAASAYGGVIGSMAEQVEKISLGATGEDESRYAQHTLEDMRANLEGGREIYAAFVPWLREQEGGAELDGQIQARFDAVAAAYDALSGNALPAVPDGWNEAEPTDEHLATEYGQLWLLLTTESDPMAMGGLSERMLAAAELMDIPVVL
jgi:iron uptake system component EfeO